MRRSWVLAFMIASASLADPPAGRDINPGVLGANALPPQPGDEPWVEDLLTVQLGWAGQLSTPLGGGLDGSMLIPFRVSIGLFRRVQFWAEGSPFELWQYSPETLMAWNPKRSKGITRADVRLATKVLVFDQAGARPAVAVRAVLKTATGEDLYTRRFLDAPAYQFDGLAAWRFFENRLEVRAAFGFFAWQQGAAGQNDAVAYALAGQLNWSRVQARLELRGYAGWVHDDDPVVLAAAAEVHLTQLASVLVAVSRTFNDPPAVDFSVACRLHFDLEGAQRQ